MNCTTKLPANFTAWVQSLLQDQSSHGAINTAGSTVDAESDSWLNGSLNQPIDNYDQAVQQLLDFVEQLHIFFPACNSLRGAPAA
jgi:hypothetical protein